MKDLVIPKRVAQEVRDGVTLRLWRNDSVSRYTKDGIKTYIADFEHRGSPESKTCRSPQAALFSLAQVLEKQGEPEHKEILRKTEETDDNT